MPRQTLDNSRCRIRSRAAPDIQRRQTMSSCRFSSLDASLPVLLFVGMACLDGPGRRYRHAVPQWLMGVFSWSVSPEIVGRMTPRRHWSFRSGSGSWRGDGRALTVGLVRGPRFRSLSARFRCQEATYSSRRSRRQSTTCPCWFACLFPRVPSCEQLQAFTRDGVVDDQRRIRPSPYDTDAAVAQISVWRAS